MYWYGILNFLAWPLIIWLSYKLTLWALKRYDK